MAENLLLPEIRERFENNEDDEDDYNRLQEVANEKRLQWAHYGAYGAGDSQWIVVSQ